MAEPITGLTVDQALYLLQSLAMSQSEGTDQQVGPRRAEITEAGRNELITQLATIAGLDLEDVDYLLYGS
jgi:hypothetical protein